jgi:hypothetical protein
MMSSMTPEEVRLYEAQIKTFEQLLGRVDHLMVQFGQPDTATDKYDFSVLADYWGYPQIKISVCNLSLLHPHIVKRLRELLADFPGWEIVYTVALHDHLYDWPNMGLYIRSHEIVDTLQRQYFPAEFQGFEYEGSRRGIEGQV